MASNSGWSKSVPSGSSSVAQGDDDIRSFKSFMQAAWEQEHYFTDGSTNSAGVLKAGAARVWQGATSILSNPTGDNSGRLIHATNNKLYIANASTSSWSVVADNVQTASPNTWSALQEFTSGISAGSGVTLRMPVVIPGIFSSILTASWFTGANVGNITTDTFASIDTRIVGAAPATDFVILGMTGDPIAGINYSAWVLSTDTVRILLQNSRSATVNHNSNITFNFYVVRP